MPNFSFKDYWAAQAVCLKEEHYGAIHDSHLIHSLRRESIPMHDKIMRRALLLAKQEQILVAIRHYLTGAKVILIILLTLALLLGIANAYAAIGSRGGQVNLFSAWITLLIPHLIMLALWLLAFIFSHRSPTLLGKAWLWLNSKFSRGPNSTLVPNAFNQLLNTQKGMPWLLSSLSHAFWLILLVGSFIGLLFLLATRHYSFIWETTILPNDSFTLLTQTLGFLPAFFGFSIPDSLPFAQVLPSPERLLDAKWSIWLIGQVVFYGIILRALCLASTYWKTRSAFKSARINEHLPVYAVLVDRLAPIPPVTSLDSPTTDIQLPVITQPLTQSSGNSRMAIGIELAPDETWPPFELQQAISNGGNLDSREQRHHALYHLSSHTTLKDLLLICDARQTPDRGILNLVSNLAQYSHNVFVYLLHTYNEQARTDLWLTQLTKIALPTEHIYTDQNELTSWKA